MTTYLWVKHYICIYYCINEDSYIYIYMKSLIMKKKEKNDILSSLGFSLLFFILYLSLSEANVIIQTNRHERGHRYFYERG